jgi:hypothetical protein
MYWHRLVVALLAPTILLVPACNSQPDCMGRLHPYNGKCLSTMAIEYVACTEGRGISTTTEIGGGVAGTLKVVANASLNLAFKKTEQEDTPVALQIVKDCMEIAKRSASAANPEQRVATNYLQRFDRFLQEWQRNQINQTPSITLSSSTARIGEQVTVTGSKFWPGEVVDIYVEGIQVPPPATADDQGSFTVVVTVPSSALPDIDTVIVASGRTSAKSARFPFHVAA